MPWETKPNEIRTRIADPGRFERFRRKALGSSGVSLVLGKVKGEDKWETQSLRFDRKKFSDVAAAKAWMKANGGAAKFAESTVGGTSVTGDSAPPPDTFDHEVFETGEYAQGTFTEADLDEIVSSYDPTAQHEAPITLDHKDDGPAYGWVAGLRRAGQRLVATFRQLEPGFRDAFQAGRFKKPSVELYTDYRGTGKKYLKAVTFLGAKAPAVKGLQPAQFAEQNGPSVLFQMPEVAEAAPKYEPIDLNAALASQDMRRKLSDATWEFQKAVECVMAADDLDAAGKKTEINRLSQQLADLTGEGSEAFAEDLEGDTQMANEDVKKLVDEATAAQTARFEEERKVLTARVEAAEKQSAEVKRDALHREVVSFAEAQVRAQRVLPAAVESGLVEFTEALDGVEFTHGDKKVQARAWFHKFCESLAAPPTLGEHVAGRDVEVPAGDGSQRLGVPNGADPASVKFSEQAAALAREKKIPLEEAMRTLDKQTGAYRAQ